MIMTMMNAASAGALMGFAATTHATTHATTRVYAAQMKTVGEGLATIQSIFDQVADEWHNRRNTGVTNQPPQPPAYDGQYPRLLRQAIVSRQATRQQRSQQQEYDQMLLLNPGETWSDSIGRLILSVSVSDTARQILTFLRGFTNEAADKWDSRDGMGAIIPTAEYGAIPPWQAIPNPGMLQQGYSQMPQQGIRQQGYGLSDYREIDLDIGLEDTIDINYGTTIEQMSPRPEMRPQGMLLHGYGPMPLQQGVPRQQRRSYAPIGRRPSAGRMSQAEERAERRAERAAVEWSGPGWPEDSGAYGFPMPEQRRGQMPPGGDNWGAAGPTVSRTRTPGSAQALSAVDSAASMNSFADGSGSMTGEVSRKWLSQQQGYGQMPMQQGYGQMQGFDQMQISGEPWGSETSERLSTLEGALLGGGSSMQGDPPLQRIAFLEAQLGGTRGGTMLERLNQLEDTAQGHGLF